MDYLTLRKRTVIKRYHDSDIFNVKGESKNNKSALPQKNRKTQGSLEKTKNDLFNTLGNEKSVKIKPLKKKIYIQNYLNTDIFNVHLNESDKKKKKLVLKKIMMMRIIIMIMIFREMNLVIIRRILRKVIPIIYFLVEVLFLFHKKQVNINYIKDYLIFR